MSIKSLLSDKKNNIVYFSGPTGSGVLYGLIQVLKNLYTPEPNPISQLQDILSDYDKIIWFNENKTVLEQKQSLLEEQAPELMRYSTFKVYNLATLYEVVQQNQKSLIIITEDCLKFKLGVIAGRAREFQQIIQLVKSSKHSLFIQTSHLSHAVSYGCNIGLVWDGQQFTIDKNIY